MKIYLEDELEEKKLQKVIINHDDLHTKPSVLGESAPIVQEMDEVVNKEDSGSQVKILPKELSVVKQNSFIPISANKIHGNSSGLVTKNEAAPVSIAESLIIRDKSLLPAVNDKEESLAVMDEEILPVINNKVLEVKVAEQKVEEEIKTSEIPVDALKVGATISTKADIGSFRDELLSDIKIEGEDVGKLQVSVENKEATDQKLMSNDQINPQVLLTQKEEEIVPPVSESTSATGAVFLKPINSVPKVVDVIKPEVVTDKPVDLAVNVANNSSSGAQINLNKALEVNKINPSANNNVSSGVNPAGVTQPSVDGDKKSESAIMIETTYTPEQVNKMKQKRVLNIGLTFFVLIILIVLGYVFGWPLLDKFMGGA